jgi:uncharacterized membrane-anchored protein
MAYGPMLAAIDATILVGFLVGLLAGAITFTWLYNSTGGSILLVALWHNAFNFVTGCVACKIGVVAAVVSTLVMVWAVVVVIWLRPATLSRAGKEVHCPPSWNFTQKEIPESAYRP